MTDKSNASGEALAAVRRQQWQAKLQDAFHDEWIEVAGDVDGTYRWERKKREQR